MGYEALARFPGYAEKNPEIWFAAARDHGKGRRTRGALRMALEARDSLPANCFLTLNVSPEVLRAESIRSPAPPHSRGTGGKWGPGCTPLETALSCAEGSTN